MRVAQLPPHLAHLSFEGVEPSLKLAPSGTGP